MKWWMIGTSGDNGERGEARDTEWYGYGASIEETDRWTDIKESDGET